jgi:hypothetical protein
LLLSWIFNFSCKAYFAWRIPKSLLFFTLRFFARLGKDAGSTKITASGLHPACHHILRSFVDSPSWPDALLMLFLMIFNSAFRHSGFQTLS